MSRGERESSSRCFKTLGMLWRAFYMTAWAAAAFYSIWNITKFVGKYLDRPTQTVISSEKPDGHTQRLFFPTITICNQNVLEKSFLDLNPALKSVLNKLDNLETVDWNNETNALIGSLTYKDIYAKSFGYKRAIDLCLFGSTMNCDELGYHDDELFNNVVSASGKCYNFNPLGKVFSKSTGVDGEFKFLVNTHTKEYRDSVSDVGFSVVLHHHTTFRGEGTIFMSPGYKYRVGIKHKIRKELPMKLGGVCDPTLTTSSYLAYDASSCEFECRDKFINDTCGCIIAAPPNNRYNYFTCSVRQMEDCGWTAWFYFLSRDEVLPKHDSTGESETERRRRDVKVPDAWGRFVEEARQFKAEVLREGSDHDLKDRYVRKVRQAITTPPASRSPDYSYEDSPTGAGSASPPSTTPESTSPTTYWPTTTPSPHFSHLKKVNCSRVCPPPCLKNYYELMVSSSRMSDRAARSLAHRVNRAKHTRYTAQHVLENHVMMEFYLADAFTEIIASVEAYGLWHLFSDCGGTMGLFLGASIFSFFAFFKTTAMKIYKNKKEQKTMKDFVRSLLVKEKK